MPADLRVLIAAVKPHVAAIVDSIYWDAKQWRRTESIVGGSDMAKALDAAASLLAALCAHPGRAGEEAPAFCIEPTLTIPLRVAVELGVMTRLHEMGYRVVGATGKADDGKAP